LLRWSTDEVAPKDRFDYWREVRAKGLFGVTAELAADQREHFRGEFSLRRLGTAGFVEMRASSYRVERSAADIANAPSDSLCIYQQLSAGGWFDASGGDDFTVHRGTFATSYSDLKYRTMPTGADGFRLRILKVPVSDIAPFRSGVHDLIARPFLESATIGPLLRSCFKDLTRLQDDTGVAPETLRLVSALTHLALIERGVLPMRSRAATEAIRVGRLSAARRLIARRLSDPNLSPARVAAELGVSVRHIHSLFEMTQMSFSQTVTAMRLTASRRMLISSPQRAIAEIAFACGFESLATFYRAFRAAFGMAPGDARHAARD
jgi:AraC-like DNA-binding protein